MSDVQEIPKLFPVQSKCLNCRYEWEAWVPNDTEIEILHELEYPECGVQSNLIKDFQGYAQ